VASVDHDKRADKVLRLYDNTRISDYKRCPRLFYYRHVRDWRPDGTRTPLVFGGGWHAAMEVIWAGMTPPAIMPSKEILAKAAYIAFCKYWQDEGMPPPDEIGYEEEKELSPRTPSQALEMIVAYIDYRVRNRDDFELVSMEKPFAVPLDPKDPTLFYVGKIDKVVKRRGKIIGIEHKTTTAYRKEGKFRSTFLDSFSPNAQVDGYLYALHMMFPDQVGGVWVDAALVHKSDEGFMFIPVERQLQHLDGWLWEVQDWIGRIEHDKIEAQRAKASDPYLRAFPKNTNSCWDFNSACVYLGLCKAWPNPIDRPIPAGFTAKRWDPLEHIGPIEGVTDGDDKG
jgi:hypothetical protein